MTIFLNINLDSPGMKSTVLPYMRSVQKVSSHILWKIETFIEEGIRNIVHNTMTPQSPSKLAPWDLTHFSQLPPAAPSYFPEFHWWSEISSLSKVILVLGKARGFKVPNLGCTGAESPGWFDVLPKPCTRRDTWVGVLLWWSCQSPVAHSFGLLSHLNSFQGGMFKLDTKFDADLLLLLLSHFECDSHTVHMLTQWHLPPPLTSTVKLSLFTHAHSSPLPLAVRLHCCHSNLSGYINNGWTFCVQASYTFRKSFWFTISSHCLQSISMLMRPPGQPLWLCGTTSTLPPPVFPTTWMVGVSNPIYRQGNWDSESCDWPSLQIRLLAEAMS